jgi:hypothetical protein
MVVLILFIMDLISDAINLPLWAYLILIVVSAVWNILQSVLESRR